MSYSGPLIHDGRDSVRSAQEEVAARTAGNGTLRERLNRFNKESEQRSFAAARTPKALGGEKGAAWRLSCPW